MTTPAEDDLRAEEIKAQVPMWAVVGLYANEVPTSGRRAMRCPFHDDNHASATIDNAEGWFNCHTCGTKGDLFSLVMHVEGLVTFGEAKDFIVRRLM